MIFTLRWGEALAKVGGYISPLSLANASLFDLKFASFASFVTYHQLWQDQSFYPPLNHVHSFIILFFKLSFVVTCTFFVRS